MAADGADGRIEAIPIGAPDEALRALVPPGPHARAMPWWALLAAILFHLLVVVPWILEWAGLFAPRPEPEAIPVALVYAPPPPAAQPPPPPAPEPPKQPEPPQPPPPEIKPRVSGDDNTTEAKRTDLDQPAIPQPQSEPAPEPPQPKKPAPAPSTATATPEAKTSNKPAEQQANLPPEAKPAPYTGPLFHSIKLPSQKGGRGEKDSAGDPYLNHLRDLVERNRPRLPASAFPGGGERVAIFSIVIDPRGDLVAITLLQSSGSTILDEAAGNMIRNTAPFPPLPRDFPQIRTLITVAIPLYPS